MTMTVEEFRAEATRLRAARKRGAPRYPREMQHWAVAYAKRTGVNISRAAEQLGISDMTLRSWVRVADAGGAFVPVTVSDASSPTPRR
jgi:transposase-like protein